MDRNEQNREEKRKPMFYVVAVFAIIVVVVIAYMTLSRIKGDQAMSAMNSQEQFESTPELSSALQAECQQSATKISKLKNIDEQFNEFKTFAANCREIFITLESTEEFRSEGMYADLSVDLALKAMKTDSAKAKSIIDFASQLPEWDFYFGPVSCSSKETLAAYSESLQNPDQKGCTKVTELDEKIIPDLKSGNLTLIKNLLPPGHVVWLGQQGTDSGCPEKASDIVSLLKKWSKNKVAIERAKTEAEDSADAVLAVKNGESEQGYLILKNQENCLVLKSVNVVTSDVSE